MVVSNRTSPFSGHRLSVEKVPYIGKTRETNVASRSWCIEDIEKRVYEIATPMTDFKLHQISEMNRRVRNKTVRQGLRSLRAEVIMVAVGSWYSER